MQINQINLTDRVAVVTGGAQGIGFVVGQRFIESGAKLVIWDVNTKQLETARAELSAKYGAAKLHTEQVDIADYVSVEKAVKNTTQKLGRIDILVNNAAIVGPNTTLAEYPLDAWKSVIDIDVNGTFH